MKLDEIQKRYNISANEPEEIKTELRKRLKESHPENNADFDSDYFMQLKEDLDYMEKLLKKSNSNERLIPINEVTQMVSEVVQLFVKSGDEQNQKEKLEKELSASILAIITFLWLFPERVVDYPLIQLVG